MAERGELSTGGGGARTLGVAGAQGVGQGMAGMGFGRILDAQTQKAVGVPAGV